LFKPARVLCGNGVKPTNKIVMAFYVCRISVGYCLVILEILHFRNMRILQVLFRFIKNGACLFVPCTALRKSRKCPNLAIKIAESRFIFVDDCFGVEIPIFLAQLTVQS
jgi:hypothetical protein